MSQRIKNRNTVAFQCKVKRSKRKSVAASCIVCPACTLSMRGEQALESHYKEEVDKIKEPFENLSTKKKLFDMRLRSSVRDNEENENDQDIMFKEKELTLEDRETSLCEIKKRKFSRYADMFLLSTNNKQTESRVAGYDLFSCAVCNEFLDPSEEIAANHLARCFAKRELEYKLYSSEDDSDDELVEEFSWAGQTWIRASSLLDSEIRREGKLTRLEMEDGDEELDVDGDQVIEFGTQQFTEADVIPCISDNSSKNSQQALRKALTEDSCKNINNTDVSGTSCWQDTSTCEAADTSIEQLEQLSDGDRLRYIDLLKEKVNNMQKKEEYFSKCPICMGPYMNPVVSTSCWHVCCGECWLRALGAKKLCPKCNSIVSPSQLRKIFL